MPKKSLLRPRASEHQVDEQEIGLPCPISVGGTGEPSSPRGPPLPTLPVSRAPKAANLQCSTRKSWTDLALGRPSESAGVNVLPRTTMDVPTVEFRHTTWRRSCHRKFCHFLGITQHNNGLPVFPQVNQQHQDSPATPRQLLHPPPVNPIVWRTNSIATQDFESTSDIAADGDTDLVGSADGSDSLNPSGFLNPHRKVVGTPVTDSPFLVGRASFK